MHPSELQNTAYERALLYEEARSRREQGNTTGALARYRRLLELAEQQANQELKAAVTLEVGEMYHQACDTLAARGWYEQARSLYEALNDASRTAWLSYRLAEVAQLLGELSDAESLFRQALAEAEGARDPVVAARARAGLGLLLCALDRLEDGFAECVTAVRQARELDADTVAQICGQVRAWSGRIGRVRYRRLLATATDDPELRARLTP